MRTNQNEPFGASAAPQRIELLSLSVPPPFPGAVLFGVADNSIASCRLRRRRHSLTHTSTDRERFLVAAQHDNIKPQKLRHETYTTLTRHDGGLHHPYRFRYRCRLLPLRPIDFQSKLTFGQSQNRSKSRNWIVPFEFRSVSEQSGKRPMHTESVHSSNVMRLCG